MKDSNRRFCDVCNEEISKGEKYQRVTLAREAAEIFRSQEDSELRPSWTENPDGTVTMDICATCTLSMGDTPPKSEMH